MSYTVERSIEDVEFPDTQVEEFRQSIRKDLVDEGYTTIPDDIVQERLEEKLMEVARDMTLSAQGHNDLHLDISYGELVEDE